MAANPLSIRTLILALAVIAGCTHTVRTTVPIHGGPSASAASACMALPDPTDCLRRSAGARVEPGRSCPGARNHLCSERREPDQSKTTMVLIITGLALVTAVAVLVDFQNTLEHSGD